MRRVYVGLEWLVIRSLVVVVLVASMGCSRLRRGDGVDEPTGAAWARDAGGFAVEQLYEEAHGKVVEACSGALVACARLDDGRVACWGDITVDGVPVDRPMLTGIEHATQIDCTTRCAVLSDGHVQCWGQLGKLAPGRVMSPAPGPHPVELADVVEVRGDDRQRCARLTDGHLRCANQNQPWSPMEGLGRVTALSAAGSRMCARLADGSVKCWGNLSSLGVQSPMSGSAPTAVPLDGLSEEEAFSLGRRGACRVVGRGALDCSPAPSSGQRVLAVIPRVVAVNGRCALDASGEVTCFDDAGERLDLGIHDAASLAPGAGASCAVRRMGDLVCWSAQRPEVLGRGDAFVATPAAVPEVHDAVDLSAGEDGSCAVLASGEVRCWGMMAWQHGTRTIRGLGDAVRVAVSGGSACALTRAGGVTCFDPEGIRDTRRSGERRPDDWSDGVHIDLPRRATAVTAGGTSACALLEDETVACWGANAVGQLGDGTTTGRAAAREVPGLARVKSLSAGGGRVCAVDGAGKTRCWGLAEVRARSMAEAASRTPACMPLLDGAAKVSLSGPPIVLTRSGEGRRFGFTTVPREDGGVQLTDFENLSLGVAPVAPIALRDVVEVAAGAGFVCGRTGAGVVRCYGTNDRAQLGDGTRASRWETRDVVAIGAAQQIAAGVRHACARVDGAVLCWGDDTLGAVGVPRPTKPARVAF